MINIKIMTCLGSLLSFPLILAACSTTAGWNAAQPKQSQAYYHFIRANYAMLDNRPQMAMAQMESAVLADPDAYYHGLEMAKWLLKSQEDQAPTVLKYVQKTSADQPNEPAAHLLAGHAYLDMKDYQAAEAEYRQVLDISPNDPEALFALGRLVAANNQFGEAGKYFRQLIAVEPNSALGYYYLGQLALAQNQPQEAVRWLSLARQKDPDYIRATIDLAQAYEDSGQLKAAETLYRQSVKKHPNLDFLQIRLARLLLKSGRQAEASKILTGLNEIGGDQTKLSLQIGIIYLEQNRQKSAADEFRKVLKKEPHNQQAAYLLASALIDMRQYEEAHRLLAAVPYDDENYISARLFLATSLADQKRYEEAIGVMKEASSKIPKEPKFIIARAILLDTAGRTEEAKKVTEDGLIRFPDDAEIHFRFGVFLDKTGDKKGAVKEMQTVIKLDTQHAEALNYLAYTWAEQGENLPKALEMARKALTLRPDSGHIMDTVGWIYYMMGQPEKALPLLEQAIRSAEDPVVWEHLGDVYAKLGRRDKAKNAYQKAKLGKHDKPESIDAKIKLLSKP